MNILSRLRLRTKLALLLALSLLAVVAMAAIGTETLHRRMLDDRADKLRAVVNAAVSIAGGLQARVEAHDLTREQAIELFHRDIWAIRFDDGVGYISVTDAESGNVLMHGVNPKLEGKPTPADAATGKPISAVIKESLGRSDSAVTTYMFPKPGQTVALRKVVAVRLYAPWGMVIYAGAYTDDLDAEFRVTLIELAGIGGAIILVLLAVAWLINRDIAGSLGKLNAVMGQLSHGDLDAAVPGMDRRDEVGAMASAVAVFKEGMRKAERLAAEQQEERARAEVTRRGALIAMAEAIELETKDAITDVGRRTAAMAEAANNMTGSATRTGSAAESAAAAAAQAQANAQTVASAAEQLTASIKEIGGQVGKSAQVVARAVEVGRSTREAMEALNEQVGRIGSVAEMIGEIAAKTNLLALNATIEAARAGDAGKGFAVVASEVKQLATQTARSTEQISHHIAEVRTATSASVAAVGQIEETIGEVNSIASSIAAAVEQQSAATAEIARNVTETASAADQMSERTKEVSLEAGETGARATEVLGNTTALNATVQELQRALVRVVRTSSSEVDRRRTRRRPCHVEATIAHGGRTGQATLRDISEHGCFAQTEAQCEAGDQIAFSLLRFGKRLQGRVVARSSDGLFTVFTDDGLPTAEVDRISMTTVGDMVRLTKDDHVAFVKRVVDAVAAGTPPAGELANHHECRLGRWYDGISDTATMALPSFHAIVEPHHAVHEAGQKAFAALRARDTAGAQRAGAELRQHSERVLRCLDDFGREYPTTMAQTRKPAKAAA